MDVLPTLADRGAHLDCHGRNKQFQCSGFWDAAPLLASERLLDGGLLHSGLRGQAPHEDQEGSTGSYFT